MTDHESTRIAQLALTAQSDEYREVWEQWKAIDTKAQGAAVVCGIVLTGLFTVLRDNPPTSDVRKLLVAFSVVAAVTGAVLALLALRVREVKSAPLGDAIVTLAKDIEDRPPTDDEWSLRYAAFLRDARILWTTPLAENNGALKKKATLLWSSQLSTMTSLIMLGLITLSRLL